MSTFRNRTEQFCGAIASRIYQFAGISLIVTVGILGFLGYQLKDLGVDMSAEAALHKDDPARVVYEQFTELFGRDDMIAVGLELPDGLTSESLSKLRSLHDSIESNTPHTEEVTSLINARYVYGDETTLYVEDLITGKRADEQSEQALRELVLNHPSYRNNLISQDASMATLIIKLDKTKLLDDGETYQNLTDDDSVAIAESLRETIRGFDAESIYLTGVPVIQAEFLRLTNRDMMVCTSLCMAVMMVLLALFFRRVSGVLLPFVVVESAVICALGVMALVGAPITGITNGMIVLMLVVGICDAVHVLTYFYRYYEESGDKKESIVRAISSTAPALILTSLTTAAGFLSFVLAELSSIADLGIYATVAVLFALFFTLTMMPAIIALVPMSAKVRARGTSEWLDSTLNHLAQISIKHHWLVIAASVVLLLAAIPGVAKLRFANDVVAYFPTDSIVRFDQQTIDKKLHGSSSLEIVIDTGKMDGVKDLAFLTQLESTIDGVEFKKIANIETGSAFSILNILKETHQALHANSSAYYQLPDSQALVAQELLLFEASGGDDIEKVTDTQFRYARITLKTPYVDGVLYEDLVNQVHTHFDQHLGEASSVHVTGMSALAAYAGPRALRSMARSYMLAGIVITGLMMLMAGNFSIGLFAMLPNLLPISISLAVMGYLSIPLDMTSIMIGSIALGVVVDDTLHFIYNYGKHYQQSGDSAFAVTHTLRGVGRAMLITTAIVSLGFAADVTGILSNVRAFGCIIAFTTVLALIADMLIAPSLMIIASKVGLTKRFANNGFSEGAGVTFPTEWTGMDRNKTDIGR
ncbi:MAG: MMPL family transporter [Deltaproteobacteria bacterium]|nr:MMPL family transporter [Deltaproteobacteria bacterium]